MLNNAPVLGNVIFVKVLQFFMVILLCHCCRHSFRFHRMAIIIAITIKYMIITIIFITSIS